MLQHNYIVVVVVVGVVVVLKLSLFMAFIFFLHFAQKTCDFMIFSATLLVFVHN
jgi:hypothetical protein